jgi:hypothetical protein
VQCANSTYLKPLGCVGISTIQEQKNEGLNGALRQKVPDTSSGAELLLSWGVAVVAVEGRREWLSQHSIFHLGR